MDGAFAFIVGCVVVGLLAMIPVDYLKACGGLLVVITVVVTVTDVLRLLFR